MASRLESEEDESTELHEINVTPFIDVILVLLLVFMVAAPLATVDIPVNLPSASAQAQPAPDKPIFLTLKSDRTLALGDAPGQEQCELVRRAECSERRPRFGPPPSYPFDDGRPDASYECSGHDRSDDESGQNSDRHEHAGRR